MYTYEKLETYDEAKLEKIDNDCWETMGMIKTILSVRKYTEDKATKNGGN